MRILVCIKQISTSDISIDESGRWINQGGSSAVAISRFDENAVEEAILLKEKLKNSFTSLPSSVKPEKSNKAVSDCEISVDVISVGKAVAAESIKRAMGMGADNGIFTTQCSTTVWNGRLASGRMEYRCYDNATGSYTHWRFNDSGTVKQRFDLMS